MYQNRNTIIIYQKKEYRSISTEMSDALMASSLNVLCEYMYRHYGKKVIILLDEYDTPMQEAYVQGYWDLCLSASELPDTLKFLVRNCMTKEVLGTVTVKRK